MASFEDLKVLLADDNQNMRSIVTAILKSLDIRQIKECRDGAEALATMREFTPDVAIVDYQMAPMNGLEFTHQVRREEGSVSQFMPIIMLTGYAERGKVIEARDAGVTELIVKPVTAKAVISRLNAVIFHPRLFVRSDAYFGPDRRRYKTEGFPGPERRKGKPKG